MQDNYITSQKHSLPHLISPKTPYNTTCCNTVILNIKPHHVIKGCTIPHHFTARRHTTQHTPTVSATISRGVSEVCNVVVFLLFTLVHISSFLLRALFYLLSVHIFYLNFKLILPTTQALRQQEHDGAFCATFFAARGASSTVSPHLP